MTVWWCVRHRCSERENSGVCWKWNLEQEQWRKRRANTKDLEPGPNCDLVEVRVDLVQRSLIAG